MSVFLCTSVRGCLHTRTTVANVGWQGNDRLVFKGMTDPTAARSELCRQRCRQRFKLRVFYSPFKFKCHFSFKCVATPFQVVEIGPMGSTPNTHAHTHETSLITHP